jgi:hypothetical protein
VLHPGYTAVGPERCPRAGPARWVRAWAPSVDASVDPIGGDSPRSGPRSGPRSRPLMRSGSKRRSRPQGTPTRSCPQPAARPCSGNRWPPLWAGGPLSRSASAAAGTAGARDPHPATSARDDGRVGPLATRPRMADGAAAGRPDRRAARPRSAAGGSAAVLRPGRHDHERGCSSVARRDRRRGTRPSRGGGPGRASSARRRLRGGPPNPATRPPALVSRPAGGGVPCSRRGRGRTRPGDAAQGARHRDRGGATAVGAGWTTCGTSSSSALGRAAQSSGPRSGRPSEGPGRSRRQTCSASSVAVRPCPSRG